MKIVGKATSLTIKRVCAWCNKEFVMTCDDYIMNYCGEIFKNSEHKDDWLCAECAHYIRKIKNL